MKVEEGPLSTQMFGLGIETRLGSKEESLRTEGLHLNL